MSGSACDHSFVVYIDESGDEGFVFLPNHSGSSRWFVLSAAVFIADSERNDVKCVDIARDALGRDPKKPLHFRKLDHSQKVVYTQAIAKARVRFINVFVYKPDIAARPVFREKAKLYHWIARLLIERVSWLCHDRFHDTAKPVIGGDGSAKIVFSNRRTMSYDDLCNYLRLLQGMDTQINWDVIDPDCVESAPHAAKRGLQVADAVASAFWCAVEPNRFGNVEGAYAKNLMGPLYRRKGRLASYEIKPYPSSTLEQIKRVSSLLNE